jgi:hypothetical protein
MSAAGNSFSVGKIFQHIELKFLVFLAAHKLKIYLFL